jgi:hypothetical protein
LKKFKMSDLKFSLKIHRAKKITSEKSVFAVL